MSFAPKPGCPMCGIVASASNTGSNTPSSPSFSAGPPQPEILWRDENFTAYREKAHPISSKGHIIIAFNLHVPSIYTLSSTDLPLLVNVRNLATRLLTSLYPLSTPSSPSMALPPQQSNPGFHIGFITPPFKDNKVPVTDHLHAHAYIAPADLLGWWRGIAYSSVAWYAIDDLIAEIRESVSNNRIKSGHADRRGAPIDLVPDAGARMGTADGREIIDVGLGPGLIAESLEEGQPSPLSLSPSASPPPTQTQIPQVQQA